MSDAVTIIGELDDLVRRLDEASRQLYVDQLEFDHIAANYEDAYNDVMTSLIESYEAEGKRVPGDKKMDALVLKKLREEDSILYGNYRRLKSELSNKRARARLIQDEISARQSQLSYLKTEAQAVG